MKLSAETKVGAVTVLGIALLIGIAVFYGAIKVGQSGYLLNIDFDRVDGLKVGGQVHYAGVDVGRVIHLGVITSAHVGYRPQVALLLDNIVLYLSGSGRNQVPRVSWHFRWCLHYSGNSFEEVKFWDRRVKRQTDLGNVGQCVARI